MLRKRADIWRKQHLQAKKQAEEAAASHEATGRYPPSVTVALRLQQKLKARKLSGGKSEYRSGKKSSPIIVRNTNSSNTDDSNSDHDVVDSAPPSKHAQKNVKCAPGPETYTKAEIKIFVRMARTIEDVDESKGHSNAVADFIDTEFSDNTGMLVKARKAPKGSWKKGRFTRACEKAAKIMEQRLVQPPVQLVH